MMYILVHFMVSHRSLRLCPLLLVLFSLPSTNWRISSALFSSWLVISSAYSSLPLDPFSKMNNFILVIILSLKYLAPNRAWEGRGSVPFISSNWCHKGSHCIPREPKARQTSVPVLQGTTRPTRAHSPRALEGKVSLPARAPASCSRTGGCCPCSCSVFGEWGMATNAHCSLSKDLQALLYQALS